ncbi:hypothetical protein [Pseudoduganella sp. UC29_71]|uniref:hypothetical protein n=1 Tax=Pseudoduganella sp. UC29_71 TaxID=3350174 RepID=UPI0036709F41
MSTETKLVALTPSEADRIISALEWRVMSFRDYQHFDRECRGGYWQRKIDALQTIIAKVRA